MPLSISSSKKIRLATASLLAFALLFAISSEVVARHYFGRISRIRHRIEVEYASAVGMNRQSGDHSILLVSNSLFERGVDMGQLHEILGPRYDARRMIFEAGQYLDWYYGLHRLFLRGSKPETVVIGLSVPELLSNEVVGDYFSQVLMDRGDVLAVGRDTGYHRTKIASLILGNMSLAYGGRVQVRNFVLNMVLPNFEQLRSRFFVPAPPFVNSAEKTEVLRNRLIRLDGLCSQYGARLIVVIPPTDSAADGANEALEVGRATGVTVIAPVRSEDLPADAYDDDHFHMNQKGAKIFTQRLAGVLELGSPGSPQITTIAESR